VQIAKLHQPGWRKLPEQPASKAARRHDVRPRMVATLFVALLAIASIPVATHPLPPLADYINHLARTYVINAIGWDANLAHYYKIQWELLPNLMIDLVVPVLNRFMGIYLAGQVFTIMAFALIMSGTLALNRALTGRWSLFAFIAAPLIYNGVLLVGVMNYIFGIGLMLWALAAWTALRDRAWPWRYAVSLIFVFLLYVCHLFAAGVYGLGLLAIETHRLWRDRAQPWWPRLLAFAAAGLPFLPFAALLVAGSTWNAPGLPAYWEPWGKLEGLMAAINVYYPPVAFALLGAIAALLAYARYRNRLRVHPAFWAMLAVGAAVYLALPRALFSAHLADQRLPIALAFMLIACLDLDLRSTRARAAFAAFITLLLAVRIVEVQRVWDHLDASTEQFLESVHEMDRGARVLVVYGDRNSLGEISDFNLVHAASLATIERSAMVTTAFTVKGKHILHVRKAFEKYVETEDRLPPALRYFVQAADRASPDRPYFWDRWPLHYDYVYILFSSWSTRNPVPSHLDLIYGGKGFQLYQVKRGVDHPSDVYTLVR
jgi:hypothetical protein